MRKCCLVVLAGIVMCLTPMAMWAQDRLPIMQIPLPFSGQGANLFLEFNVGQETHKVALRALFDVGAAYRMVVGDDAAHPERLPMHVLTRHGMPSENAWRGAWSSHLEASNLPEFWAIHPIWGKSHRDTVLLACDLSTEEGVGIVLAWWTKESTLMERFIPVSGLDRELSMRTEPWIECDWQADGVDLTFQDSIVYLGMAVPGSAFPGAWVHMKARPTALDFSIQPTGMRPLSFGQFRYTQVVDDLVLLDDSNRPISAKQAAKAAKEIAAALGLAAFDLVRGQAGVSAFFLRDYDQDTYLPIWEQHWLGRWEAGKWVPAPPLH